MRRMFCFFVLFAFPLLTQVVLAQDQDKVSPDAQVMSEPPPSLMPGPALKPKITRTKRGAEKAEEFRIGGKLYMIKISPKHGTPYYLVDDKGNGSFARTDKADAAKQVPPWVLNQFYCPTY